jgi:hypothetical protein
MPDYSRPHFADPFLGAFGNERSGALESDLPAATDGTVVAAPPQNLLLRVIAILVVAAVVYFLLKKLSEKKTDEVESLEE